jgi:hypothetical protein
MVRIVSLKEIGFRLCAAFLQSITTNVEQRVIFAYRLYQRVSVSRRLWQWLALRGV